MYISSVILSVASDISDHVLEKGNSPEGRMASQIPSFSLNNFQCRGGDDPGNSRLQHRCSSVLGGAQPAHTVLLGANGRSGKASQRGQRHSPSFLFLSALLGDSPFVPVENTNKAFSKGAEREASEEH